MTSICDERGQELLYSGIPITDIFKDDLGIGGVLGLLWFQRRSIFTCIYTVASYRSLVAYNSIIFYIA